MRRVDGESLAYGAAIALLQIGYVVGAVNQPNPWFGINQLRHLGPAGAIAVLALAWPVAYVWGRIERAGTVRVVAKPRYVRFALAMAAAVTAAVACFLFRSHSPNPDGVALAEKIPHDVARFGAHVTHDEMLELLLHSHFYQWAHELWGWSVATSYQVLAAVAGGAFVMTLANLARRWAPERRAELVALALCGGYVQLFFGDVENYTVFAFMVLVYLALSYSCLEDRAPLWTPALALSLAICLHLLGLLLLPSLLYLCIVGRRRARVASYGAAGAALVIPVSVLLAYLHYHGLPIQRLFDSSHVSGMGGHYARYLAPLRVRYYGGLFNTAILLLPTIVVLPALAWFRRLGSDRYSHFLQWAAGAMILFLLLWRAQLGVYEDWNLFASGMIPVAVLIAGRLTQVQDVRHLSLLRRVLLLTGAAHTFAWVLSNHYRWS